MSDIVAFLTARLAEDDADARTERAWAEVAAKRALLREIEAIAIRPTAGDADPDFLKRPAGRMLCTMVMPYADHPDYEQSWSVE